MTVLGAMPLDSLALCATGRFGHPVLPSQSKMFYATKSMNELRKAGALVWIQILTATL
jgi:hypothetical protein